MEYAVLDREDVFGIGIQSFGLEKGVELVEVSAIEEHDCRAVWRNGLSGGGASKGEACDQSEQGTKKRQISETQVQGGSPQCEVIRMGVPMGVAHSICVRPGRASQAGEKVLRPAALLE